MTVQNSVVGKSVFVKLFDEDAKIIEKKVFGDDCSLGDQTDINTKVWFRYTSVEGHPVVEMEVAI